MKRQLVKAMGCLILCVVLGAPLFAAGYISSNDLDPGTLSSSATYDDGFVIKATNEKKVSIEAVAEGRKAADGEVFNTRIKLGGSGSKDFRSVSFPAARGEKAVVYLNSSSKSDARILVVADAQGTVVASLTAPPDADGTAGIATCLLPAAGTYTVYSKSGGINIYQIIVE